MLPEHRVEPVRLFKIDHVGGGELPSGYSHSIVAGGFEEMS
jgi:hypothetical protein